MKWERTYNATTLENRAGKADLIGKYGDCGKNYRKIDIIIRNSIKRVFHRNLTP